MGRDLGRHIARQRHRPGQPAAAGVKLRRATVVTWDSTNGHVIWLDGANLSGVPVLVSAGTLSPGDTVAVLRQDANALILGKIQILAP